MGCSVAPSDLPSGIQFVYYFIFTVVIYNSGLYSCWNTLWWGLINRKYGVPSHHTVFAFFTCVAVFEAWGAWRIWFCDGWVIHMLPIIFYFAMIVCTSMFFVVFMLAPSIEYSALVAVGGIVMSILYTIFAYSPDVYAFVTGLVNIGICIGQLLLTLRIFHDEGSTHESYNDYATIKAQQMQQVNVTQDQETPETQTSVQSKVGFKISTFH
jgi:hypothetical protein